MDYHSSEVLLEHRADEPLSPASLTKMMTAYVLFQQLRDGKIKLDDSVTVSADIKEVKGSLVFLRPNTTVKLEILLRGMIIKSANDAAVALAEHVAGSLSNFVSLMNQESQNMGFSQTRFENVTGRTHSEHYSTAREIAKLAVNLQRNFPQYYKWFLEKKFTYHQIDHYNQNALLWRDPNIDGVMTGFNRAAGYCLAASATREDMRLVSVVLGAPTNAERVQASHKLLDFGFNHYETHLLYRAQVTTIKVPIWMGETSMLPLGLENNIYTTVPRGSFEKLAAKMSVGEIQYAPIRLGQKIGTLSIMFDKKTIEQYPLVALREVGVGNIYQRTIDRIKLWLK